MAAQAASLAVEGHALSDLAGACQVEGGSPSGTVSGFVWMLLPRHGMRPLRCLGRSLLRIENRAAARTARAPYWSTLHIYEVAGGCFAAWLRHLRCVDDTACWQHAWHADTQAGLLTLLRTHAGAPLPLSPDWFVPDPATPDAHGTNAAPGWAALLNHVFPSVGQV